MFNNTAVPVAIKDFVKTRVATRSGRVKYKATWVEQYKITNRVVAWPFPVGNEKKDEPLFNRVRSKMFRNKKEMDFYQLKLSLTLNSQSKETK